MKNKTIDQEFTKLHKYNAHTELENSSNDEGKWPIILFPAVISVLQKIIYFTYIINSDIGFNSSLFH